jgi:hypothetical protein
MSSNKETKVTVNVAVNLADFDLSSLKSAFNDLVQSLSTVDSELGKIAASYLDTAEATRVFSEVATIQASQRVGEFNAQLIEAKRLLSEYRDNLLGVGGGFTLESGGAGDTLAGDIVGYKPPSGLPADQQQLIDSMDALMPVLSVAAKGIDDVSIAVDDLSASVAAAAPPTQEYVSIQDILAVAARNTQAQLAESASSFWNLIEVENAAAQSAEPLVSIQDVLAVGLQNTQSRVAELANAFWQLNEAELAVAKNPLPSTGTGLYQQGMSSFPYTTPSPNVLPGVSNENLTSYSLAQPLPQLTETYAEMQTLTQESGALREQVDILSGSYGNLASTTDTVTGATRELTKEEQDQVNALRTTAVETEKATVSIRSVLLDLRMFAFGLRTLKTELGANSPELTAFTDQLIGVTAAATMVIAGMDLVSKSAQILAGTDKNIGFAASLTALLEVIWPVLAALAALAIVWAAIDWAAHQGEVQQVSATIQAYTDQVEALTKELDKLKVAQRELNLETSRYSLIASQIDYEVRMQGFETPQQKATREAAELMGMRTRIENQKIGLETSSLELKIDELKTSIDELKKTEEELLAANRARIVSSFGGPANQTTLEGGTPSEAPSQWAYAQNFWKLFGINVTPPPGATDFSSYDFGGANGFEGSVRGPTRFLAGEESEEWVSIKPFNEKNAAGVGSSQSVNATIHVDLSNSRFGSPSDAHQVSDIINREVSQNLERLRWGAIRP